MNKAKVIKRDGTENNRGVAGKSNNNKPNKPNKLPSQKKKVGIETKERKFKSKRREDKFGNDEEESEEEEWKGFGNWNENVSEGEEGMVDILSQLYEKNKQEIKEEKEEEEEEEEEKEREEGNKQGKERKEKDGDFEMGDFNNDNEDENDYENEGENQEQNEGGEELNENDYENEGEGQYNENEEEGYEQNEEGEGYYDGDEENDDESEFVNNNDEGGDEEVEDFEEDITKREARIKEKLAQVPFNVLVKLKKTNNLINNFNNTNTNEIKRKSTSSENVEAHLKEIKRQRTKLYKKSKGAPEIMSSKYPKYDRNPVVHAPNKPRARDPRFDESTGRFHADAYKRVYGFVGDMRLEEINNLKKQLKETSDGTERTKVKKALQIVQSQHNEELRKEAESKKWKEWREKEKEKIKQGKKPRFLTQREVRESIVVDKFENLKQKGELEKFTRKRRERLSHKDKKNMPFGRRELE